tara:strand:- start:61 stop:597 length:537 start_codon:yes stop_codon:yes gene_type:complete
MIEIINTSIPHRTNKRVIEHLTLNTKWMFACDKNEQNLIVDNITKADGNDSGFIFKTFAKEHGYTADGFLNMFALFVKDICTEQSKRKIGEIIRIYWNMYVPSSKMKYHYDMPEESNCLSIIYNLHNNDGGTNFKNNKIVKSKEGQAVVFDSHNLHKGISSKNIPVRYALNIVCKTDD